MVDIDIVEMYWKRDERALQYSEKKYKAYCLKIADNILNNKEDSEECVNDALLVAWNEIPPKRPGSFRMFLARITRNGAINRLKSYTAQKRHGVEAHMTIEELSETVTGGTDVEGEVIAGELKECIGQFVEGLSEREGDIFTRRYFFTESIDEISKAYGLTGHAVSVILDRARKKLRAHLVKEGYINEG